MKKLFLFTAAAALISSAAFAQELAQSYNPDFGTGNVLAASMSPGGDDAFNARAQAGPHGAVRSNRDRMRPALRETDPDPNIRFQLYREQQENVSGD
jgi:hypothetical protein